MESSRYCNMILIRQIRGTLNLDRDLGLTRNTLQAALLGRHYNDVVHEPALLR